MERRKFIAAALFGSVASTLRLPGKVKAGDAFKKEPQTIVVDNVPIRDAIISEMTIVSAVEQNVANNGKIRDLIIKVARDSQ
jgi:hypothetical protein